MDDDIKEAKTFTFTKTITEKDVITFAKLTGDSNPLHTNKSYARKTGFKRRVVHGMLVASISSRLIGEFLSHKGSLWVEQNFKFNNPVFISDTLTYTVEIVQYSPSTKSVKVDITVKNQYNNLVLSGKGVVMFIDVTKEEKKMKIYKVGFITGGSRGIGKEISIKLAKMGVGIAVNYHQGEKEAEQLIKQVKKNGGNAIAVKADIRNNKQVSYAIKRAENYFKSSIDILICNAGTHLIPKKIEDLIWNEIQDQIDIQLKGSFNCLKEVLPSMISNNSGKIIIINSAFTWSTPPTSWTHYICAKSALYGLMKSLAVELGPKGITVNSVSPGMTDTQLLSSIPDTFKKIAASQIPLRRLAQPEEIASAVAFLVSTEASYINGADIPVAGGSVMR